MAELTPCADCERLNKESQSAYRSWMLYRPFSTSDRRPKSRWFKDDKAAYANLEKSYHLAQAKYDLHTGTHSESAEGRDVVKNINIVMRGGRLTP
jgi:hypothetical protein